jgi:hypothetical protein
MIAFAAATRLMRREPIMMDYKKQWLFSPVTAIALLLSTASLQTVSAATAPSLGTAASFAVLGASTVTNTGPSVITGDLGLYPGSSITGFPPGIVNGTIHQTDAVAMQAQADALTAYNSLAGQPCSTILTGMDLGGKTLTAGVYCFSSSAQLTGTLTLDAQGNPNAVFIFQIGSTLTTASNSSVVMINSGVPCNVFFQVGSSATLGTGTLFLGNILALQSDTLTTNATVEPGRVFALHAAVTLDTNTISVAPCSIPSTGVSGVSQVCSGSSLGLGDSIVNLTNTGASGGNICVNVYAFAADEQEVACCSCLVTPNALWSASVKTGLLNSTLTSSFPNEVVIKLISSVPNNNTTTAATACNPATVTAGNLANGLLAWGTTVHGFPTATGPTFSIAETPCVSATLSAAELQRDVQECQFIQVLGSGQFGICKGCQNAGLGAAAQ